MTMTARGRFWTVALGASLLGFALYYQSIDRPTPAELKFNAQAAKLKIDGIRRCVEAVDKQLPESREKAVELKSKCLEP